MLIRQTLLLFQGSWCSGRATCHIPKDWFWVLFCVPIEHSKWENGNFTVLCIAFLILSTTTISCFTLALPFFIYKRDALWGCEAQKGAINLNYFPLKFFQPHRICLGIFEYWHATGAYLNPILNCRKVILKWSTLTRLDLQRSMLQLHHSLCQFLGTTMMFSSDCAYTRYWDLN